MDICAVDDGHVYLPAARVGKLMIELEKKVSAIDPIQYGALTAQVKALDAEVNELRKDVKTLLELANKSRGGFWAGMTIASSLGGVAGFIADHFLRR